MQAIKFCPGCISLDTGCFRLVIADTPRPRIHDLLVSVQAVSVNPVDTKVRDGRVSLGENVDTLGWDAAGVVVDVGCGVRHFRPGDEVFYSGDFARSGANAELHAVDERLVGHKPTKLSFAEAAAMPLASLTAWELLFDALRVAPGKHCDQGSILILGGAGGVGSMLIQLARRMTALNVIASASRPESREWCRSLGAHHVIDHSQSIADELAAIGNPTITHVAALNRTDQHWAGIAAIISPRGKVGVITDHDFLDAAPLRLKSASLHWENVVTCPFFNGPDIIAHHRILEEISGLADAGVLRSTMTKNLGVQTPHSLTEAHRLVETGRVIGKVVLTELGS